MDRDLAQFELQRHLSAVFDALPEEERENAWHIQNNLRAIESNLGRYEAALALKAHGTERVRAAMHEERYGDADVPNHWRLMAARDAAMCTYDVTQMVQAIDGLTGKSPTLKAGRDMSAAGKAREIIRDHFPRHEKARTDAAHGNEFSSTPVKLSENRLAEDVDRPGVKLAAASGFYASDNYVSGEYAATVDGKWVTAPFSEEALSLLRQVYELTVQSFVSSRR